MLSEKEPEAKRYEELVDKIRMAFQKDTSPRTGRSERGTQTSYVVALYTKMAPEASKPG